MAGKKKAAVASKPRKPKQRDAVKKVGKKANMAEFRAQLDSIGVNIVKVTADGNSSSVCRAMGDQLEVDEEQHMKYREMVVQYIVEHRQEFEPFIEDEVPFDEYCGPMMKDGTWAGNMELQAASLVTSRNICIHMTDAHVVSTSNNGQTKAKDLKKSSNRSTYDDTSVKLVMAGTGCSDVVVVEHVLRELDGDVEAAIEYMIAEHFSLGSDNVDVDSYMDYAWDGDEVSTSQNEYNVLQQKEEESCSSKYETVQNSKSSHAKKDKSKTKECSCGSTKKHKASCSLATVVASKEPPRTKGAQGKAQKGKKQKKKEQAEAPMKERKLSTKPIPDLGALCI